jgi:thiosulfate reductase cytochrome b subunit
MWLLVANGLLYIAYGLASGHFTRRFLPLSPRVVWRDFRAAIAFRLLHTDHEYNAVQRAMYAGVMVLGVLIVGSGLSLWKPVQLDWLASLFGGYEWARRVHFFCMAGFVLFIIVHLALVLMFPRTLPAMITGGPRLPEAEKTPS